MNAKITENIEKKRSNEMNLLRPVLVGIFSVLVVEAFSFLIKIHCILTC